MPYTIYAYSKKNANETGAAMHLALRLPEGSFVELNGGFPVLSPKCSFTEGGMDGQTKGMQNPVVFREPDGTFGITAERYNIINGQSVQEPETKDQVLYFTSRDLISYTEKGLRDKDPAPHGKEREEIPAWDSESASPLVLSDAEAQKLLTRFTCPPAPDGTKTFSFPFMPCRGDPMAIRNNGKYLFMATDDEHGQNYLKIRESPQLDGIPAAHDHILLTAGTGGDCSGCLWAPELHRVNGKLCIFFAAGSPLWYTVQSRIMILTGTDPLNAEHWTVPRRIVRSDGTPLAPENCITLDMTVIHAHDADYVVWSQRYILTDPVRCGTADLFIARLNSEEPWKLAGNPVLLSRPEYGWERIHSPVNEGPFALIKNDTIYLTYSAALIDATYCLGMLTARNGSDLLDPLSWQKSNYPVLHRLSHEDQIGTGHNSFVEAEDGTDFILYHALAVNNYRTDPADGRRYPSIRTVIWDKDTFPHF
jgi:GH43 family beta-xylosidase